jgi:diguanylate cyclase (GGDEF)-like protein
MGWQAVVALNLVIVVCYLAISMTIFMGLRTTRQLLSNRLAVATGTIFMSCALHHGHHAFHLLVVEGPAGQTDALRAAFGTVHGVATDALGALVAVVYLALRRSYGTLLSTPAMFEDQVRLATEQRLREMVYVDALSGCGNRAAYDKAVDDLTGSQDMVGVVFMDLDVFKAINDTYGHEAGDRVLRLIGGRLALAMGEGESAYRLGGDEFVLLQVGRDVAAVSDLAVRCRALVAEPVSMREGWVTCTASVGMAHGPVSAGLQNLLREADTHMYSAKRERAGSVPGQRAQLDQDAVRT